MPSPYLCAPPPSPPCAQPLHLCPPPSPPCAQPLPLWQKAVAGLAAGGLGALVGTPADLTLIRLQADSTLPEAQKRHYKGVGDALVR